MVYNDVMVELELYIWIYLPQVNNNKDSKIYFAWEGRIKHFFLPLINNSLTHPEHFH